MFNSNGVAVSYGAGQVNAGDLNKLCRDTFYCGNYYNQCRCGRCGGKCGPQHGCPCNSCKELTLIPNLLYDSTSLKCPNGHKMILVKQTNNAEGKCDNIACCNQNSLYMYGQWKCSEGCNYSLCSPCYSENLRSFVNQQKLMQSIIPIDYLCPITLEIMKDPVVASDGITYERSIIEEWFKTKQTSPKTGFELPNRNLSPNITLRSLIQNFCIERPNIEKSIEKLSKLRELLSNSEKSIRECILSQKYNDAFYKTLSTIDTIDMSVKNMKSLQLTEKIEHYYEIGNDRAAVEELINEYIKSEQSKIQKLEQTLPNKFSTLNELDETISTHSRSLEELKIELSKLYEDDATCLKTIESHRNDIKSLEEQVQLIETEYEKVVDVTLGMTKFEAQQMLESFRQDHSKETRSEILKKYTKTLIELEEKKKLLTEENKKKEGIESSNKANIVENLKDTFEEFMLQRDSLKKECDFLQNRLNIAIERVSQVSNSRDEIFNAVVLARETSSGMYKPVDFSSLGQIWSQYKK